MFVSQWWLVSWLLHFTRFAQSHFPSLSKSFWMTPVPSSVALHHTAQSCRQTCCGCTQSHWPGKLHITYRHLFSASGLVWIWSRSDCANSLSLFSQEGLLQVQSTTDAYPGRIKCASCIRGCLLLNPQTNLILSVLHCLYWDFSFCVLWCHCHWYHMGRRDISVTVYQIRAAETKGMW